MLIAIPDVLTREELAQVRATIDLRARILRSRGVSASGT